MIPGVCVCVEGGPGSVQTVWNAAKRGTPVVVIKGTVPGLRVCVCVRERERERERDTQIQSERECVWSAAARGALVVVIKGNVHRLRCRQAVEATRRPGLCVIQWDLCVSL